MGDSLYATTDRSAGTRSPARLTAASAGTAAFELQMANAVGVGAAVAGAGIAGLGTEGIGDQDALLALPDQLWRVWLALAEAGAIGFAFATLARSPLAGVGAGIALYFIESFAALLLPDVVRWLPFSAAAAVISGADTSGLQGGVGGEPLEPTTALVVVLVWLLGALAVAAVSAERAEITG